MTLTLRRVERAEKRFIELGGCTLCAATPKTYEVVWVDDENDSAEEYCP
jgi:hypothetical protein